MESRGNPELDPQFTNSFEVNYTRNTKLGSITSGVFYRNISDEISRTVYNDPNNINRNILSYDNFDNNNAYGIESSANLKFSKWWSVNASADIYFKTAKGTIQNATTNMLENAEVDVTTFNTRINNSFTATKDLRFQLFGMYRGRDRGLQYDRKAMYKMDFGATYNVLKGKGTVTVRYNDVFENMRFAFDGKIPYRQVGAFYWESQTFYIGFNYVFGGGKNRALARKQRDANETQGVGGMF
jgi:outer membrane receptor for ferrienterochelin and colicin